MRRRKRERRTIGIADCRLWIGELKDLSEARSRTIPVWTAHRIMTKRIPRSMTEKAQSSMEPKAMGVKMIRKMRMSVIEELIIFIFVNCKALGVKCKLKTVNRKS